MKISYDTNGDVLRILLNTATPVKNMVVNGPDMVLEHANDGSVIGLKILTASKYVDGLVTIGKPNGG